MTTLPAPSPPLANSSPRDSSRGLHKGEYKKRELLFSYIGLEDIVRSIKGGIAKKSGRQVHKLTSQAPCFSWSWSWGRRERWWWWCWWQRNGSEYEAHCIVWSPPSESIIHISPLQFAVSHNHLVARLCVALSQDEHLRKVRLGRRKTF